MLNKELLVVSSEVSAALKVNQPVVALESTVIAHGLPRPQNLQIALSLENTVRTHGSIPATIAILKGKLRAGLDKDEIRIVARETEIRKISTRDLPIAITQKWDGATTVASSSWIAYRAGIRVFATGGIGGVHRGSLPDISADLPALAATPIIVVCSGAKIVLDLPATREWLETHGVTVIGFGCDEMPAFYSRRSGLPVDVRVNNVGEAVEIFRAQKSLGIQSALLVTVPVPEQSEVASDRLYEVLERALEEAEHSGIAGRELTPFLLSRMAKSSEGATLNANISLLENNARVAAQISKALSEKSIV
jgi:pseudouridine-5'-phosphate glycosidase